MRLPRALAALLSAAAVASPNAAGPAVAGVTGTAPADSSPWVWRYQWKSGTDYSTGAVVRHTCSDEARRTCTWLAKKPIAAGKPAPGTGGDGWALVVRDGRKGAKGNRGRTGATGPMGLAGQTGARGAAGATGAEGAAGARGATGAEGAAGARGAKGEPGETGVAGATGATGATGPTGPLGYEPLLGPGTSVASGTNLKFDSVMYSSGNISYNPVTGVFTFNEAGRYVVEFAVSPDGLVGTPGQDYTGFAISTSQGDFCETFSAITQAQLGRTCVIEVTSAPVTMSLVNAADNTVNLAAVPIQAWLTLHQHSGSIALEVEKRLPG